MYTVTGDPLLEPLLQVSLTTNFKTLIACEQLELHLNPNCSSEDASSLSPNMCIKSNSKT
jgi:hypothetical protein